MRLFISIFLISCGGGSGAEEAGAPGAPGANKDSPDHVPIAGEGEVTARLSGRVEVPDFAGGMIQMDAVAEVGGQSHVVANERYEEPSEFRLVVRGEHKSVDIFVYLIAGDSGPGAGDTRFEYPGNPVELSEDGDTVFEIKDMVITVIPVESKDGAVGGGLPLDGSKDGVPGDGPPRDAGPASPPTGPAPDAGAGSPPVEAPPALSTTDE
jgi:hypothetical protein